MSEGFVYHLPAEVGEKIYLIANDGRIYENTVSGYIIKSRKPHDNRVCLTYTDHDGTVQTRYRSMGLLGKTIFTTRRQAEVAIAEGKVE